MYVDSGEAFVKNIQIAFMKNIQILLVFLINIQQILNSCESFPYFFIIICDYLHLAFRVFYVAEKDG